MKKDELQPIFDLIGKEMKEFEYTFQNSVKTHIFLLDKIMNYIVKRKGKQVRPMFVFLCAKLCGEINASTYRGAALVELLHTATLVHDDVVDDANFRRGFFSINALWKNKISVLVGDYLLSRGLLLSLDNNDFQMLKIVSQAVKSMSEGELLQMEKARNLDITEEVYFEIIKSKTASLIASCCGVGASSSNANEEVMKKIMAFGENIGIAFQIKDDLFDYGDQKIGKPLGIDIKEKKMTLPLIYALNMSENSLKKKIINIVRNENENPTKVNEVISFVKEKGGLKYAELIMIKHKNVAFDILSTFPETATQKALQTLVNFVIDRKE